MSEDRVDQVQDVELEEGESETIKADGFDEAVIGVANPWQTGHKPVLIYDTEKCIELLMNNLECDYDDASEYFHFNVAGAYVGEQTPIFVQTGTFDDLYE